MRNLFYSCIRLRAAQCLALLAIAAIAAACSNPPDPALEISPAELAGLESPVVQKIDSLVLQVERNPDSGDAWGRLGVTLYIHGRKNAALPYLEHAAKLQPRRFKWTYYVGCVLAESGDERADDWLAQANNVRSDYVPLHIRRADLLRDQQRYSRAAEEYSQGLRSKFHAAHAHLGLARTALATGDTLNATRHVDDALKQNARFREALGLKAELYRFSGQPDKAAEMLHHAAKYPKKTELPDDTLALMSNEGVSSFWHQWRADRFLQAGNLDAALKSFRNVLAILPESAESHANVGAVLQHQGDYAGATQCFERALGLDSSYAAAWNNLAALKARSGEMDAAIAYAQRALTLDPLFTDAYLNLGSLFKLENDRASAIASFRQGRQAAPEDMRFVYQLAWLLATSPERQLRNGSEALALAESACQSTDYRQASVVDCLAAAYAECGQFEAAVRTADRALQLAQSAKRILLARQIYERKRLYQQNRPYREGGPRATRLGLAPVPPG